MSTLTARAAAVEFIGREPWPSDVRLFTLNQERQSLLPHLSATLSVQTFLRMTDMPFTTEERHNALEMSPSGAVPFLRIGALIISEFQPIVSLVAAKGRSLTPELTDADRADMKAYMTLVEARLGNAELYLSWQDDRIYNMISRSRCGSPYPWPLKSLIPDQQRASAQRRLQAAGWASKTLEQVVEVIRGCCDALSERLGEVEYFFGESPCELDALVYGHLSVLRHTPLPTTAASDVIHTFPLLMRFTDRIDAKYFGGNARG